MSAPEKPTGPARLISPLGFALGLAAGLALLAWKGRDVAKHDWHAGFTRFHPMISPEALYEPTVDEMCSIVRSRCRPGQVLVIVGGNSILLGVGQPADKMWTRQLQDILGDRYAVVNLAFRGASPNDAGAVVAEVLRNEFPRQIYVANEIPFQSGSPIGIETYRFALLDAYFKGRLLPWKPRDRAISSYLRATDYRDFGVMDLEIGAKLDSWLYFHNFWNWISYNYHFTFGTPLMPHAPEAFWPRSRFEDKENDFDSIPFEARFTPQVVATDLNIARSYTAAFYRQNSDKTWTRGADAFESFLGSARAEFPDPLKRRTLILVGRNSPYYTRQLEPEIHARDELAIVDTLDALESLGYGAVSYGRDFSEEDFGDRTHLTTSGGAKLAAIVASKVEAMAGEQNYIKP